MKKVSAKLFFVVMKKGLCQVLEWFFGLFGYKKDGIFVKCIWRLLAAGVALLIAIFAVILTCVICNTVYGKYYEENNCYDKDCRNAEYLSQNIYYHNTDDGRSYVFNSQTKEKILRRLLWISKPLGEDSLVCFCDGEKRGYFNKNTGRVVIPAKYDHAWVFSEGLASVDEDGSIMFIDGSGKIVIDNVMSYKPGMNGLVFHGGFCIVDKDGLELCSLIDKKGMNVLSQEYNSIICNSTYGILQIQRGDEYGVYDQHLNPIIPMTKCRLYIEEGTIDMTMPDHTMRKYDLKGNLIDDFYYSNIRTMEYEKDEVAYRKITVYNDDGMSSSVTEEPYHPQATARLRAYVAGDGFEGLMTADGHRVTMPLYHSIEAIGPDLYACTVSNGDIQVVNGRGKVVE